MSANPSLESEGSEARPHPAKVELWLLNPEQIRALAPRAAELLTEQERDAGPMVHDETLRRLWEGRQVALRLVLAEHLDQDPAALALTRNFHGKPCLPGGKGPRFSVSSSEGWWLAALSDQEVGVDLEVIRPMPDVDAVAQCYFNETELACLQAAPSAVDRLRSFYRFWTRKEALLKLKGQGMSGLAALREQEAQDVWLEEVPLEYNLSASLALPRAPSLMFQRHWVGTAREREAGMRASIERIIRNAPHRRRLVQGPEENVASVELDKSSYSLSQMGAEEVDRLRKQAAIFLSQELPAILETLPQAGRFVDLGSGVGVLADAVAGACPEAYAYGFDIDTMAVAKSKENFGDRRNLRFECRGIEQGPPADFPGADVATLRMVLMHHPDPRRTLEAVKPWLRPGGTLHVLDMDDRSVEMEPQPAWLPELLDLMQVVQKWKGGSRQLGRGLHGLVASAGWRVLGHREITLDPLATVVAMPKVFLPVAEFYLREAERLSRVPLGTIQKFKQGLDELKQGHLSLAKARVPMFHVWGQNL